MLNPTIDTYMFFTKTVLYSSSGGGTGG